MNVEEHQTLEQIYLGKPWDCHKLLGDFLKTTKVVEEPKGKRTGAQNRSLHLWFRQVADVCKDAGLDAKVLFSKTLDIEVTQDHIKALWHTTQNAYFKSGSTTELDKQGQIEKIYDTLVRFFGERHNLALPPFPNDPEKNNIKLQAVENLSNENYPEMTEATKANKF